MDADTSSAEPSALFAYASTGLRIDAQLEATAARLAVALDEFAATCREYPLGIDSRLAQQLFAYARRTRELDLWVRRVAEQFVLADQGPAATDGLVMGTLDSATSVADWSAASKLEAALERAIARLPSALAEQLRALLTPENVAALVIILGVWAASHAFGVGEIMDLILAVGGVIMLGPDAIRAVQELAGFATTALNAQSDAELDAAGKHLATAVAIVGVDGTMALLAHKAGGDLGGRVPKIEPAGPRLVTPEGVRISVGPGTGPPSSDLSPMSTRGAGGAPTEPTVNPDIVSFEAVQESQAALQRALDAKADLPQTSNFIKRTTASDDIRTISGAPQPLPDDFTPVSRQEVFDHADQIGYQIGADFRDTTIGGPQGAYNATHAEKQLVVVQPDDPIGITTKICDDCLQFLRYDAKYNNVQRVTTDPTFGTLVFQPDGSILRPDGSPFTIIRSGNVVNFPPLDVKSGSGGL